MTDAQNQHDHEGPHDGPHEGPIKTPKQLILAVFYSFVIPIGVIVMLAVFVTSFMRPGAGSDLYGPEPTARRIAPVGMVQVKDSSDLSTLKTGEQVFGAQCTSCHMAGLVGAPKLGDGEAWGPRIAKGYDALLNSAVHGKGNMGPQGGGDFTDFEIGRAVVYMANKAGGKLEEPKPPAPGASAPATVTTLAAATETPPTAAVPASGPTAAAPSGPAAPVVATVAAAEPAKADAGGAVPALYTQVCQVCHAAGVAGAPKLGDKAAWAPRIAEAKDLNGLTAVAIKGKGAMPPRGGSNASDDEIRAVVAYMMSTVK